MKSAVDFYHDLGDDSRMSKQTKLHIILTEYTRLGISNTILPTGTEALVETYTKNRTTGKLHYLISYMGDKKEEWGDIPTTHTKILGRKASK